MTTSTQKKAKRGRPRKAPEDRVSDRRTGRMFRLDDETIAAADRVAKRYDFRWGSGLNRSAAVAFCIRHVDEASGDDPAAIVERARKREVVLNERIEQLEREQRALKSAHERLLKGVTS